MIETKFINNWKVKRNWSNKYYLAAGIMFPWTKRKYLIIGLLGLFITIHYGEMI